MKRFVASLLLFFFTAISFQQLTVFSVFVLNQDYIAEYLCINKDKPEMQCNGKCHLNETLAQTTSEEKGNALSIELQIQFPVFISQESVYQANLKWLRCFSDGTTEKFLEAHITSVFHPPPLA